MKVIQGEWHDMSHISETTFNAYLGPSELATLAEMGSLHREVERNKA